MFFRAETEALYGEPTHKCSWALKQEKMQIEARITTENYVDLHSTSPPQMN